MATSLHKPLGRCATSADADRSRLRCVSLIDHRRWQGVALIAFLAIGVGGCGSKTEPLTAHGKPVSHWLNELRQTDPKARIKAVGALQSVGAADPLAVPALVGALKDQDKAVRDAAVLALLNIGPDARDAANALAEAQSDKDSTVRNHAAKAFQRIQGNP